jgi:multiple sugar transport system substrate-binding protein
MLMGGAPGRRWLAAGTAGVVLLAATLLGCGSDSAGQVVLRFDTGTQGVRQFQAAAAACSKASGGRYAIEQRSPYTRDSNGQRLALGRRLAAHDPSLDIMELDVIFTAEFAEAGWILPFPAELAQQIEQGTLKVPLQTGMYRGKLYGAPLSTNTQLLWYRKDLVPHPPKTWDEMVQIAENLAARGLPHYIEVQGKRYEGLTVWFNTLLTSGGGSIVTENGEVQVAHGDAARRAVGVMARVATSRAADPSLSVTNEDDSEYAVEAGTAAFEVNYPFAYSQMYTPGGGGTFIDQRGRPTSKDTGRRVKDVFGWTVYPSVTAGTPARVTIGGINLGVSATSRHPAEAFEAAQCLRNRNNQLLQAVGVERPPTLAALYDDPAFQQHYPAWQAIRDSLNDASMRPNTPAYNSISIVISELLHPPAEIDPNTVVNQLAKQIATAVTSQGLVP